ncbi:DHS-like NAD/FAD-binding domain-containing protein [Penicillium argentinense]|uniref:DHS-like NAD/FAD-binding domain-containing protein n=1 Tax=Penicillium argentinense TaxID=1131581 RepID=A0A9W9ENJ0_9EURO|nr:DHS-like NAD/FAD-binding domain-containing protein [Penicillium argentinense]KAJ5085122.1 DHS-like NAD/FAD-binding domain-containing protein [Penicillium argentinense]
MIKVMESSSFQFLCSFCEDAVVIKVETREADRHRATVNGVDNDGTMTFLQSVRLESSRRVARAEPFVILVRELLQPGDPLKFDLEFMGHYNGPNLELVREYSSEEEVIYFLEFNPQNGEWSASKQEALAGVTKSLTVD